MPAKTNPKKQNLSLWLSILVIILICILPIPIWARALIIVVFIVGFAYWRRSVIFFVVGNRKLVGNEKKGKHPDEEKAWEWYRKAWNAHIRPDYAAIIASTFIQRGDPEYGKEILEGIIAKSPGTDLAKSSKVAMSMAYWRLRDLQGAIDLLEEVRESGYKDKNLYVNLGTYLLEKGDYKRAKKINDEAKKLGPESAGITDNCGWYYIATGDWNNARKLYQELIEDRKPKFPEAYLHGAQVKVHFGEYEDAIDLFERALGQKFVLTAGVSQEVLEELLDGLRDPARRKRTATAIDASFQLVASGKLPLGLSSDEPLPENPVSAGPALTAIEDSEAVDAPSDAGLSDEDDDCLPDEASGLVYDDLYSDDSDEIDTSIDDDDDDREPNTDLDETDYLEDFEEGSGDDDDDVDYDIDDDDDREPNTDLDEEDDLYDDSDDEDLKTDKK